MIGEKFYIPSPSFPLRIGDPQKEPKVQFKGYDLVDGYPIFKYLVDGSPVRQRIAISKTGAVQHQFSLQGNTKPVYFLADESHRSEDAEWTDGHWKVRAGKMAGFSISTGGVTR